MRTADASHEPLITGEADEQQHFYDGSCSDVSDEAEANESALAAPGLFIWILTFSAGVSGLLFGYDTGVISSTLVSIKTDLSGRALTTWDKSVITSCTSLFALAASPVTGILADYFGRKRVILAADILFVLGAAGQSIAGSVGGMVVGRSVVGIAIGSASFVVPLYISELAPTPFRGRMVTISCLLITGGQVVAYIVGWLFSAQAHGWRWMVGLGAVPAAVQLLTLGFMPETPRWLIKANRKDQAKKVLRKVYSASRDLEHLTNFVVHRVEKEIHEEEKAADARRNAELPRSGVAKRLSFLYGAFGELWNVGGNRRALVIACMLQGAQQLCGFNSLMYFSATIFSLVGFKSPTLTSLSIATTNFLFTLVAFHHIDRVGRRRILLCSIPVMIVGLALCSFAFNFIDLPSRDTAFHPSDTDHAGAEAVSADNNTWAVVILAAMIVYVAGYALGLGNVPWQQSELFPLSVRSVGSALATATNWGSNFVIGLTFLPMMEGLTPVGTFALYAVVCIGCLVAIYIIYPETAGLSLEEVGGLLKDGWGVEKSVSRQQERGRRREDGV